MADNIAEVDVRPILRSGGEPFPEIMKAVSSLQPGQSLRLLATFKPVPLFAVMQGKGYTHEEKEIGGGDWEVLFSPSGEAAADVKKKPVANVADPASWPDPVAEMDNRDLDPPEPMVKILAATEEMQEGEVLSAILCRKPAFLIPEIEKRGHAWHGDFLQSDSNSYQIFIRIGSKGGAA